MKKRMLIIAIVAAQLMAVQLCASEIHDAVAAGDIEQVRALLADNPALINERDTAQSLPLHLAAHHGRTDIIELLLSKGADINTGDRENTSPLTIAAMLNQMAAVRLLTERGAQVTAADINGETPILSATRKGNLEMVQYLVEHGASLHDTSALGSNCLLIAASHGADSLVAYLLTKEFDIDAVNANGHHALNLAILSGHTNTALLLIEHGADVNHHGRDAGPPLETAVTRGERQMAGILLDGGAEVNFTDRNYGRTMLHFAAINGDSAMAQLLLDHGAAVGPLDRSGRTPIYYAVHYANPTVVSLLTAKGAALPNEIESSPPDLLSEKAGKGEAVVWYLKHSGWAVKTANHLLVFDYFVPPSNPDRPCLANGRIDPQEIKDFDVTVFSSHEHGDHYDTTVFEWRNVVPRISYVLGHRPRGVPEYQYTAPRTDQMIDGMRVRTIRATDAGVGFLVEVDGLVIFHAGDHANGEVGLQAAYTDEIDYLASLDVPVDLAFLPISGCGLGSPESVREGLVYALQKLAPSVFFPQHAMGNEHVFRQISDHVKEHGLTVQMGCSENSGDCFHYRDHRVL